MREIFQRHPLTAALTAIGVVLLLVIATEIVFGVRPSAVPPSSSAPAFVESKLLPAIASAPAEQAYPETGSRPLFSPTRRPAPQATAATSIAKGQFVLQGVTIVGDVRIAMLRDKTGGRVYRVEKGRDINGVVVAEIEPERVTLRSGDDSEVIPLFVSKAGAGGSPATQPPGAAAAQAAAQGGPFSTPPAAPAAAPAPGMPAAATPAGPAGANPANAQQSPQGPADFGPRPRPALPATQQQQGAAGASQATPAMTPEELLARRRARRQGQSQ